MPGSFWLRGQGVDRRDRRIRAASYNSRRLWAKNRTGATLRALFLRPLRDNRTGLLLRSARRRNDTVHAQIFHHLAVMIEGMADRADSKSEPRDLVGSKWTLNLSENIVLVDAVECLVQVGE